MQETECLFCGIIEGRVETTKVLETDTLWVVLVPKPMSDGHALVIPRMHVTTLHEIPDDVLEDIMTMLKRIGSSLGHVRYTLLQNSGDLHVHFHLIPLDENYEPMLDAPRHTPSQKELDNMALSMKKRL
jgi:diadenosine tetraphosphate (Ap4A) HIT family hydrolase